MCLFFFFVLVISKILTSSHIYIVLWRDSDFTASTRRILFRPLSGLTVEQSILSYSKTDWWLIIVEQMWVAALYFCEKNWKYMKKIYYKRLHIFYDNHPKCIVLWYLFFSYSLEDGLLRHENSWSVNFSLTYMIHLPLLNSYCSFLHFALDKIHLYF